MEKIKQVSSNKIIFLVRKVFYNTPVMHWALTGYIYDKVFTYGMPDLSKPIKFREGTFFVDANDRSYLPSMVGGYYEKHELDIFIDIAAHATTLFDIGANIGMYSVLAAKRNTDIACHAFEPVEENQRLLKKNLKLNQIEKQVVLVKRAVSNKSGRAVIHLSTKLSGTHSLSVDRGGSTREISTTTVDDYCKEHSVTPDLIKIDVEGHEASVFEGMRKCLKAKPTILMEYIPELNKDMQVLIKQLGDIYTYCFVVDSVNGKVTKIPLRDIDQSKMYNIILSNNKSHIRVIEQHMALAIKS